MALVRLAVAAAIAIAAASPALAAPTFTQPDTSLLPAFVEAVRVAIEEVRPDGRTDPNVGRAVERLRRVERATAQAPPVELLELGRATRPSRDSGDWMSREHWLRLDVDSLKWFYGSYLEDRVIARPDTTVSATIERRVQAVRHADLVRAQREGLARLRRYEVKYGPGSPRLNVVEVLLNAGLQRLSVFAPGKNGPSPYEALLAYSTSYATIDRRDDTRPVSVLEAGVRRYTFGWDPDSRSVWARMLKPRYGSLGVAIAERRDGALRWPLSGAGETSRVGPFLTWGDLKVAVLLGPDSRFLLSRQMHLLPNLF
jgi:hypothetical protein